MKKAAMLAMLALFLISAGAAACTTAGGAPQAVETYLKALAAKDDVAAVNASCLAWEQGAFAEASSFEAVDVTLEGLACSDARTSGDATLVRCEGTFVANYGGEVQNIDISPRTFQVVNEGGTWKMCGYAPSGE